MREIGKLFCGFYFTEFFSNIGIACAFGNNQIHDSFMDFIENLKNSFDNRKYLVEYVLHYVRRHLNRPNVVQGCLVLISKAIADGGVVCA